MSCGDQICKIQSSASNALGFSGTGVTECCKLPCTALPIHTVVICVLINSNTAVKIQQGCSSQAESESFDVEDAVYSSGQTYDSWGRSCRVVTWTRQVPDDAFIRMRFIPAEEDVSCDDDAPTLPNNQLLKFEIDGLDVKRTIDKVNRVSPRGTYEGIKAGCYLLTAPSCCAQGTPPLFIVPWRIDDIPRGAEIITGPMNLVPYSYPPTPSP